MPVLVTGSDNPVAAGAVRLLAGQGGEVRVFVQVTPGAGEEGERRAAGFRESGCKVALGHLDDEGHVESALEQVHTVLHLLGRPIDDPDVYLERTATVVAAAIGARCRRLVLLSDLAAGREDLRAGNPWLEAVSQAEELVAEAPLEGVVLRCATIHGPGDPLTIAIAGGALGPHPPGAHWPVAAADVATTAVLADAEREVDSALQVVVALTGPERVTTQAYVEALAQSVRPQDRSPAGSGTPSVPDHVRALLHAEIDRPHDALGLHGTSLADAWS